MNNGLLVACSAQHMYRAGSSKQINLSRTHVMWRLQAALLHAMPAHRQVDSRCLVTDCHHECQGRDPVRRVRRRYFASKAGV